MADNKQQPLSDEDRKILEDAHRNMNNPDHPANKDHPKHHEFLKKLSSKFGNAAIFGAGATFGSDMINSLLGR